jgi:hypothetical protein
MALSTRPLEAFSHKQNGFARRGYQQVSVLSRPGEVEQVRPLQDDCTIDPPVLEQPLQSLPPGYEFLNRRDVQVVAPSYGFSVVSPSFSVFPTRHSNFLIARDYIISQGPLGTGD